jgi:hypothetical protein
MQGTIESFKGYFCFLLELNCRLKSEVKMIIHLLKYLLLLVCFNIPAFSIVYTEYQHIPKTFENNSPDRKQPEIAKTYFIDSKDGNDNNNGLSPKKAWQSLSKVNSITLAPGSKLLFKAGGIWIGQLRPLGSGTEGKPIIIDQYGKGPKPLLDGNGIIASGVIKLNNQSYWEINNLEIINTADADAERRGVEINGSNAGLMKHIYLKNLTIHDIRGTVGNEMSDKRSSGIYITVTDDRVKPTRYDDVRIEECLIYNCQNQGIVINNEVKSSDYPGSADWEKRKITNLVIRNNTIHHISKNAMIIRLADKGIIERNRCYETALGTTGNTIFSRSAQNTVFQYNEGFLNRSHDYDGCMYDPDLMSPGTIWQYSYSHDNAHGLVWFCTVPRDTGVIVRYNVSQNDKGNLVYINYGFTGAEIYNNTFYIGKGLNPKVIVENPKNSHTYSYVNNMVFNTNTEKVKFDLADSGNGIQNRTITNNIFYGTAIPHQIDLTNNLLTDPLLIIPNNGLSDYRLPNYKLKKGSPALGAGSFINYNGVSHSKKPNIGYYSGPAIESSELPDNTRNLLVGKSNSNHISRLKNIDKREVDREMERYRAVVYHQYAGKNNEYHSAKQNLKDTAIAALRKLKIQEQLLAEKNLWSYSGYRDLLADMKITNEGRKLSLKNGEVIYGPIEFTEQTFYDYQMNNALITLKRLMEGKEIPVNDKLLKEYFTKLKQTIYSQEKYTFQKMKRQVKDAYVEEQYALLIYKMLFDAQSLQVDYK